ncbi:cuticle protein CP14.6-like [Thrips palmi]|uniref:Cuticle protein CP14.6-like n=1 Tax=Thrips palmi TaxID=161013 RepID=A0A6P8ZXC4_THRPL|nr:cuticle protein CP14.6-like [Thrips palmi]
MRVLIFAALFAVAAAAPQFLQQDFQARPVFRILSDSRSIDPSGRYFYQYETENGIKAEEEGDVKRVGNEEAEVVRGSFQYVGTDGQQYAVTYTADENGFHPQGAHLPVAPAIPEAILRSLEYNAAHGDQE